MHIVQGLFFLPHTIQDLDKVQVSPRLMVTSIIGSENRLLYYSLILDEEFTHQGQL